MKLRNITLLLSVLLAAGFFAGCTSKKKDSFGSKENVRTVVLVSIDTWRRDANGFLGKLNPSPTPFIDSIAAKGLVVVDAMTPVPTTGPSHWSMITGTWPWKDGVRVNGEKPVPNHNPTLAQLLRPKGWRSAAFVSCRVLDHSLGFKKGFEYFDDKIKFDSALESIEMPERKGDLTLDAVSKWLQTGIKKEEKLFLWVHLFDPHFPYNAPTGPFNNEKGIRGLYLGEVAFADMQVRRLSEELEKTGRPMAESLWVIISDHGEALGAHGEDSHGHLLHGVTTRIPLIISGPGVPRGEKYERLSATVDVYPTILKYTGAEVPANDGSDLLNDPGSLDRAIPLETLMGARGFGLAEVTGLRRRNWLWESSPIDHLWDLEKDPLEKNDLGLKMPGKVRELKKLRKEFSAPAAASSKIDPKIARDLQSLGYVTGNMAPGRDSVRQFVKQGGKWHRQAITLQMRGKYREADVFYRKFLQRYPKAHSMWQKAGMLSVQLGNFDEALRRFRKSIELNPEGVSAHLNMANIFYFQKRYAEAGFEYRKVLESTPEDMVALYNMGLLLSQQGKLTEAAVYWEKYLKLYPDHKNAPYIRLRVQNIKNK
ncbi:MAG: sulfatase-like hydrolase/transferase [Candidatus Aminicenantes bacterium]|nr:sulfatase-like hydrolase/transferase [Candidatus Aminicenantes bacterium]